MRSTARSTIAAVFLLVVAGCGGNDSGDNGSGDSDDPCSLATTAMVADAFGGTVDEGEPGVARNCTFAIEGGAALNVDVYHYGSADSWDSLRSGFEDNRGGTTDVPGVGSAAFHPNDAGPSELVVRAGSIVFSVSTGAFGGLGPQSDAALLVLASEIAAAQGG
jgi:hypothetical protein